MAKSAPLTVEKVESDIAGDYTKNPTDMTPIFQELGQLRQQAGSEQIFQQDLTQINQYLEAQNILPNFQIDEDPTSPLGFKLDPIEAAPASTPGASGASGGSAG